jgi:hypothetical protein
MRARRVSSRTSTARRYFDSMSTREGSIIAAIITIHIPMKQAAASSHVCPGIRIQATDRVHPPGIGMPPDIDPHQSIVRHALAMNRSAHVPRNGHSRPPPLLQARQLGYPP